MASPPASVEEYLRRTEKPNAEYIDGVVRPKLLATTAHALLVFFVVQQLRRQGLDALPEVTVRLSPTKYFIPDAIAAEQIPCPYPTEPVFLCVEVLSPEDRLGPTLAKCEEYHAWGVPHCWVLDPLKQIAWDYPRGGEPTRLTTEATLQAGTVAIRLNELFEQLAK